MRLAKKVALVTGAGRGIGRGIALRLAREGARVMVNYPIDEEEARDAVEEIAAAGGEAHAVKADVSNPAEREAMFGSTLERWGRLDILVNNAAFDPGVTDFLTVDEKLYDQVLDVNLKGPYFCCQAAAKTMIAHGEGGRIVNISSIHGQRNFPSYGPYSISKGGLDTLTRQFAMDLAPHRITVNAIAPGFIEVARTIGNHQPYSREAIASRIPIGRVGFPADIASLVVSLCDDEAGFITGQVILCDGGTAARMGF